MTITTEATTTPKPIGAPNKGDNGRVDGSDLLMRDCGTVLALKNSLGRRQYWA